MINIETDEKYISKNKALIIYIIAFYTIWALFELFGKTVINDIFHEAVSSQIANEVVIKNFVWTLPAALHMIWDLLLSMF